MIRLILTLGVLLGGAIYYYVNNQQQQQYGYGNRPRSNGPKGRRFRRGSTPINTECGICLDPIIVKPVSELLILGCGHVFCRGCIEQWRSHGHGCPLCRTEMGD